MKTSTIVIGVLLFAIATAIIYGWGLGRERNQEKDLMNLLYSKGESEVNKYLKNNDGITLKQTENLVKDITVKLPFSKNRAGVTDKRKFAENLLAYMVRTGQLENNGKTYTKLK